MDTTLYKTYTEQTKKWQFLLSMPFIYGMIFPMLFLHLTLEIYHQVCFRLYHIPHVNSKAYIFIDRHHLRKLTSIQKFNCMYCGYVNGLLAYAKAIAGETEKYWCAIKHDANNYLETRPDHEQFLERKLFDL